MKITNLETIPVSIPVGFFKDGMCKVRGVNAQKYNGRELKGSRRTGSKDELILDDLIIKIYTDEDVIGVGAAAPDIGFFGEPWESVKAIIDQYMAPKIIGLTPLILNSSRR